MFFRFNYQLLWEEQDQAAFRNFPQTLTHTELLHFIIYEDNKHPFSIDPTQVHIPYFENISFDHYFRVEQFETSDSRPNISSDTTIENPY